MPLRNQIVFHLFIISNLLSAQPYERVLTGIPVSDGSGIIPNTFSGGHNNIEPQFIDIDGDNDLDLFYIDSDNTYGWYKNTGDRHNPEYILSFDSIAGLKFSNWFYMTDIDNDNDYDIFTGGTSTLIELRRNTGSPANPFFTLEADTVKCLFIDTTLGKPDSIIVPIFTDFGCNNVFVDIDSDGDNDLFLGNSVGTVYFYKNIGDSINFSFKFITDRWEDILIFETGFRPERHGASSIEFADIDNDNDYDLFWGDFFGKSLYFIQNNGNEFAAAMDTPYTYKSYPQNEDSILTSGFNMPRLADIDADNDLDMFVSVLYDITVPQSLMFYRNLGNSAIADFNLEEEDFLKTLDGGIHSSPVFIDIDADGDKDLFIGSGRSPNGRIIHFENIGTPRNPSFILMDSVYSGIEGELTITPSFGDLDADGDYDLIVGEFSGRFSFYRNTGNASSANFEFVEQLKDAEENLIDIGDVARPFLIDIDNDNDLDLVTGGFNGQIRSYRNIGTAGVFNFTRDTAFFNSFDAGNLSSPFLIDYDTDGDLDLFTGEADRILFYRNDGDNSNPSWNPISNKFLNQTFGGYVYPFFTDIDDDTDQDIFIGNIKGGIYFFESLVVTSIINKKQKILNFSIKAFPNPFNSYTNIRVVIEHSEDINISIFSLLGEKVKEIFSGRLLQGVYNFPWNGNNEQNSKLSSGNYFVVVKTSDNLKSVKITFLK